MFRPYGCLGEREDVDVDLAEDVVEQKRLDVDRFGARRNGERRG
jgi:hypothetical protein